MKKQLLAGAFVLASFLTAQAQEVTPDTTFSFETSEGYTVGPIHEQNDWTADLDEMAVTASEDATEGANYLVLGTTNEALPSTTPLVGAFSPALTSTGNIQIDFDIKLSAIDADPENPTGASFFFGTQSNAQQKTTARIGFFSDGQVGALATGQDGQLNFFLAGTGEGTDFEPFATVANQWYHITVVHAFQVDDPETQTPSVGIFIDGELVFVGDIFGGTAVDQLLFLHDNLDSTAYVDNITVTGSGVAGLDQNLISKLAVYPNPANDVVNITNNENVLVNGVVVTDLNGRTVKTAKFAGVAEAQINVSDLASGVYMMTISSDKGSVTKKIVKN